MIMNIGGLPRTSPARDAHRCVSAGSNHRNLNSFLENFISQYIIIILLTLALPNVVKLISAGQCKGIFNI